MDVYAWLVGTLVVVHDVHFWNESIYAAKFVPQTVRLCLKVSQFLDVVCIDGKVICIYSSSVVGEPPAKVFFNAIEMSLSSCSGP